jgi:hypothetical protein
LVSPLIIALLIAYITTRPTKADEGRALLDVVLVVINVGALCALGYAVSLNVRDAHRASRVKEVMEDMKKEHADALRYACAEKLRELDRRRVASEYPLLKSGKLHILAEDALWLIDQLGKIVTENKASATPLNITRPLAANLLTITPNPSMVWQRCRLISFAERLRAHMRHALDVGLKNREICRWSIPNDMTTQQVLDGLGAHRKALIEEEAELLRPYNDLRKLLATEIHAATSSSTLQT